MKAILLILVILISLWFIARLSSSRTHFFTNLVIFTFYCLVRFIPPWKWPEYYRLVEADHLARVRKAVWELKKQRRVYEDREGRLWSRRS